VIRLNDIIKGYKLRNVLDGLKLEIGEGESIAIQGRSGSGKTTLIKILTGLMTDYSGEYFFEEASFKSMSEKARTKFRREKIGIITQHFDLLEDQNVRSSVALGISHLKLPRKEKLEEIKKVLSYVGLSGYEKKRVFDLSGGEKQRVAIARALIKKPKIVIADEPTGALDEETKEQILNLFKKMIEDGTQFIIVTHDNDVAEICEKTYNLKKGYLMQKF